MTTNLPEKIYSENEIERAKQSAKRLGWVQGGGVVIGGALLWNLIGWIPVLIALVGVGWVLLKWLGGDKGEETE